MILLIALVHGVLFVLLLIWFFNECETQETKSITMKKMVPRFLLLVAIIAASAYLGFKFEFSQILICMTLGAEMILVGFASLLLISVASDAEDKSNTMTTKGQIDIH